MKLTGIIFSNIFDSYLGELTMQRTMASLPFGGRYRQIDFILSNMVNSNISTVGVITKYNYQSLMDHLGSCAEWDLNRKNGGLFMMPPFGTGQATIYRGKIEALYGALTFLNKSKTGYILLSDTNNICNIDFEEVLQSHIESKANITVIANREPPLSENDKENLVLIDDCDGNVVDIKTNCKFTKNALRGMGMYIIKTQHLIDLIEDGVAHGYYDLESDYIQKRFNQNNLSINVFEFKKTVLRNYNVNSYFKNNFRLLDSKVRKDIFDPQNPIYTKVLDEVPTFYNDTAEINDCLIADGCRISGKVENSIIFRGVKIAPNAVVKNCIIMQGSVVGNGANLENVILDKEVIISPQKTLIGAENNPVIVNKKQKI